MHPTPTLTLDTGDSTPVLDTRVELLDRNRPAALVVARTKSAEALHDISGRVAR